MNDPKLKLVGEDGAPADPGPDAPAVTDLTPKMMAYSALATLAVFLVYGLHRLRGLEPPPALLATVYVAGAAAGIAYGLCLLRAGSWPRLMAMLAAIGVFTGTCFAVCQSTHNFVFLLIGGGALLAGFLTALFRNIDERVSFMPMVVSLLVSTSLILFILS